MFTPAYARASSAYRLVGVETSVQNADPHYLVHLLFDELLRSISTARGALARQQVAEKCAAISKAVRILEEGLKAGLNKEQGGELAQNLGNLYDYCVRQLTRANARNDDALLLEVRGLLEPLAHAWQQINPQAQAKSGTAVVGGA